MKADYDAAGKTSLIASDMASIYDRQPYQILKTLAGGDLPWEDGSGKLSIVLETLSGASGQFQYDEGNYSNPYQHSGGSILCLR